MLVFVPLVVLTLSDRFRSFVRTRDALGRREAMPRGRETRDKDEADQTRDKRQKTDRNEIKKKNRIEMSKGGQSLEVSLPSCIIPHPFYPIIIMPYSVYTIPFFHQQHMVHSTIIYTWLCTVSLKITISLSYRHETVGPRYLCNQAG